MKRDAYKPINSSFLSHPKDAEAIVKKLFVDSRPHSDTLKRLLVINTKDCLSDLTDEKINEIILKMTPAKLIEHRFVTFVPKLIMPEHEEVKSYILISFNDYFPNYSNSPEFRDCSVSFDIVCHTDYWQLDDYELRPLMIAGYIDGILNECKLSGIGTLNFMGCKELVLDEHLAGYTLMYKAVHGNANDRKTEMLLPV